MTADRIKELRALVDAATPGPWAFDTDGDAWVLGRFYDISFEDAQNHPIQGRLDDNLDAVTDMTPSEIICVSQAREPYNLSGLKDYVQAVIGDADAAFIAAARTALPEALDALERVRAFADESARKSHALRNDGAPRGEYMAYADFAQALRAALEGTK